MRRKSMVLVEEAAVTHVKGVIEFVGAGPLGRSIGGCKRNRRTVRLPRELLNRGCAFRQLLRLAAGHFEHEDLVMLVRVFHQKGDPVS